MNTRFTFGKLVNIFIVFISILMMFNLIIGDKNISLLQEKKKNLKNLKYEIKDLILKKKEIDFLLAEFNKNNSDLLEVLIKDELNYKANNEKIFYYQ